MPLFVIEQIDSEEEGIQPAPKGAQALGHAAGARWYKDAAIPAEGREPTAEELSEAMLELPAIRRLKASARRKIEATSGDIYDVVADQAKQIEAMTALVSRMAVEQWGGAPMADEKRAEYLSRAEAVVAAIESPDVTLRSDIEPALDLIMRALYRTSRANEVVDDYVRRRDEVLS